MMNLIIFLLQIPSLERTNGVVESIKPFAMVSNSGHRSGHVGWWNCGGQGGRGSCPQCAYYKIMGHT